MDNTSNIPVLFERKEDCCGCTACYAICPQSAITMQPDFEGFLYPIIDARKCTGCKMCLKTCPVKTARSQSAN